MGDGTGSTGVLKRPVTSPVPALPVDRHNPGGRLRRVAQETVIVLAFVGFYEFLRTDMVQDGSQATAHALSVVRVESSLGLFREGEVQRLFLHAPDVLKAFNLYYGGTHFVVPAVALMWLALHHPERYAQARTALGVTTGLAFAVFWAYPVAPPRLLPARYGIIDTLVTFQQSGHLEHSLVDSAGDIYAAMPSLHVAWALWCTLALYPLVRNRWLRVPLVAYPVLTTVVVVSTGNHFITDAVSGALLATVVWLVLPKASAWLAGAVHRIAAVYATRRADMRTRSEALSDHDEEMPSHDGAWQDAADGTACDDINSDDKWLVGTAADAPPAAVRSSCGSRTRDRCTRSRESGPPPMARGEIGKPTGPATVIDGSLPVTGATKRRTSVATPHAEGLPKSTMPRRHPSKASQR
jgi:hypothetical protein